MNLPKAIIVAAAALAMACGGNDDKTTSASADEAQQSYGILLTHLDFAFDQAHANALSAADNHEDFTYSGDCTSGGTLDVTGSVDENQGNDGTLAFTYTQSVTFTGCSLDGSVVDGPLMQTETFTEQISGTTLTEVFEVQLASDALTIHLVDANNATTGSFTCKSTNLDTTTTITEVDNGQGQVPTRAQTVDGSGTLCARPWDDSWGDSYQFSALE